MSYYELGHPMRGLGSVADVFKASNPLSFLVTKEEQKGKEALAKVAIQQSAEDFRQQQEEIDAERKSRALEAARAKVVAKLNEVERQAVMVAQAIEGVRQASLAPEIEGDSILDGVDARLADLEEAIVRVQTDTVVDLATDNTTRLAVSFTEAQSALVTMHAIETRASRLQEALFIRTQEVRSERDRIAELQRQQAALEEQERQRQQRALEEEEYQRRLAAAKVSPFVLVQLRKIDEQIKQEGQALEELRRQVQAARLRLSA